MVELIKSTVKCYKKKTKKTVGGRKKTYEYNQYQVPLKKSDNLSCSEEVLVIPQKQFEESIRVEVEAHLQDSQPQQQSVAEYEKELAELEWKHGQLSKSYKELLVKYNKNRKTFESAMESIEVLKEQNQQMLREIENKNAELRQIKNKYKNKVEKPQDGKNKDETQKEKDFWSVFRGRRG
jgi:hypothetical protein